MDKCQEERQRWRSIFSQLSPPLSLSRNPAAKNQSPLTSASSGRSPLRLQSSLQCYEVERMGSSSLIFCVVDFWVKLTAVRRWCGVISNKSSPAPILSWCSVADEPQSYSPHCSSWITGWLSVLPIDVTRCASSAATTSSSSTISSFKSLRAKSSAWFGDFSDCIRWENREERKKHAHSKLVVGKMHRNIVHCHIPDLQKLAAG